MINFGSSFLTEKANKSGYFDAYSKWLEDNGLEESPENDARFRTEFFGAEGYPSASVDDVLDHIDHVVQLVGIDHVGIGSDFDGVEDTLPTGLKDVSMYPNLVAGLIERGYSDADIRKILSGNLLRVWHAVEEYAASQKTS
jgi:membrane dipeptidase